MTSAPLHRAGPKNPCPKNPWWSPDVITYATPMRSLHRVSLLLVLGTATAACKSEPKASVECKVDEKKSILDCDLVHNQGSGPLKVCFDVSYKCNNNHKPSVTDQCETVRPGDRTNMHISFNDVADAVGCESPASPKVANIKVSEK